MLSPLRSETKQRCTLSQIMLEFLSIAVRQKKEVKGIHIGKEEIKLCLFVDYMTVYIENPKNKNLQEIS